jgi:hypothetical protein
MQQAPRHDGHVLSTPATIPWLRPVIDRAQPPDGDADALVTLDVVLTTAPVAASPAVGADWVVDRAHAVGLARVARCADVLVAGVTCWRAPDGTALSSLPQRHVHYAPTGIDWGFGGSGAADLALNVLARFLPLAPDATGVVLRDGSSVSEAAWVWHQECKYALIAPLPRAGGHLPAATIRAWISTHPIVGADPLGSPLELMDGGPPVALGR